MDSDPKREILERAFRLVDPTRHIAFSERIINKGKYRAEMIATDPTDGEILHTHWTLNRSEALRLRIAIMEARATLWRLYTVIGNTTPSEDEFPSAKFVEPD